MVNYSICCLNLQKSLILPLRKETEPSFSFTHNVSNIRFERTARGNIHLLATIDGREVKHVFTPKKEAWKQILDAGFNQMANEQKRKLVIQYLLGKVKDYH